MIDNSVHSARDTKHSAREAARAAAKLQAAQRKEQFKELMYRAMPFADTASDQLPWSRLLRLSLFQVSCGMALVLLNGTLNRVMIIELSVPAWLVATMVALPMLFAPFRALIGFRSDHHRSAIGWRRVPYLWMGSLLQFGGLAIMPFALLLLSGDGAAPEWLARAAAALAFMLVGLGLHTSQTAGLALATDVAKQDKRPQVVALLYVVLLLAMLDRNREERPAFARAWQRYIKAAKGKRFLVAVVLGTAGFSMQDILLEPYGAQILNLSVGATTMLTALLAAGSLAAFMVAAWRLKHGACPTRIAATGVLIGIVAFCMVIFAEPLQWAALFRLGTVLIGFGAGLFALSTLIMAMTMVDEEHTGLSLGAWGAAQATAAGVGIALGGLIRDLVTSLAVSGVLGDALSNPAVGYSVVYHLEIALLFVALAALGPLTSVVNYSHSPSRQFPLAEFPN